MGSIVGSPELRFGPFELDRSNARLLEGGREVALRPKSLAVLAFLVERPGRLVRKDDILDAVWPGTAVSDTVLKVCVREIRKALGDDPARPRFIETAHRLGYRFIATLAADYLPVPVDRFVGRDAELQALEAFLERGARLVTLTGPGGCGKTALALELARRRRLAVGEEIFWVELEALQEPLDVARAVASATAVREQSGTPLEATLASRFRARGGVLLLDNCEHVIEAVARLATALLRRCPSLRIIATSRESLRIAGEQTYPVPPLSHDEAGALFTERARAASPHFEPAASGALGEICDRLDGLPLAIELAATTVGTFGLEALSQRLLAGGHLLDEPSRRDAPRHRSLRAAVDWSHEALSVEEQRLFRRVGVFAGSFSVEAVAAVAAVGAMEGTTSVLRRLVERSLVVATGTGRFRLLDTIRHYAREKLRDAAEEPEVESRFVQHSVELVEREAPRLNGAGRRARLEGLDRDYPNLVHALRLTGENDQQETQARISGALVWFWFHRGYWTEGREHLARAARTDGTSRSARVLFGHGLLAWASGDSSPALSFLDESTRAARAQNDEPTLAYALVFLGMALVSSNRPSEAQDAVARGLALFRRRNDDVFGLTVAVTSLGIAALACTRHEEATELLEEGAALARAAGDLWLLALATRNLGIAALRRGELDRAVACLRESLDVQDRDGEKWFLSRSLEMLASALALRGESESAVVLFGAGEALRDFLGAAVLPMYRADYEKGLTAARRALEPAEVARLWSEGRALDTANLWKRAGL